MLRRLLSQIFPKEMVNAVAVLRRPDLTLVYVAKNIITTAGDVHLAQRAAGETPTNAFTPGSLYLYSASVSPGKSTTFTTTDLISGTEKTNESGYPKTNDTDTDNTGKGPDVITRKYFYTGASFSASTIIGAMIARPSAANGDPVYAAWDFTSFAKTSSDTLTVYHNTDVTGV
jgi:hypothetical protein